MFLTLCRVITIGLLCYSVSAVADTRSNRLADIVSYVCLNHGCSVTSWIRTPKRNKMVGGVPKSKHLSGHAMDVVPDGGDWSAVIHNFRIRGLKVLIEEDHLHVQIINR